jgi:hypothetical protein
MRPEARRLIRTLILVGFVFFLIRFFPIAIRAIEAAALGIREFWWVILIFALGGWSVWVLKKRI